VYHNKSLALNTELGSKEGMASDYGDLGNVEELRDNLQGACDYWRQSFDLYAEIGAVSMRDQVAGWLRESECPDAPKE
jgi:hypothetical protein